jgi:hypothetical protein
MDAVAPDFCWGAATTSGFVIPDSDGPVVDSHEVGVLSKFGNEFTSVIPLSCSCYHGDRHEALLMGSVDPVGDLIQNLIKVSDGKSFPEPPASIGSLPVAVASSVLGFGSLVCGCIG